MAGLSLILSASLCLTCNNSIEPNTMLDLIRPIDADSDMFSYRPTQIDSSSLSKMDHLKMLREWIKGRHLVIATLEDYPLSYTEVSENGTRIGKGVSFEAIDFLKEKFNFTYEVVVPKENIIGSKSDFEGSLLELLNTSAADLAAAFIPQLSDSRGYIFYSTTTLDEGEWIMVMKRPKESATGSGLMAPFDFLVWILILISLFAVGPIIYVLIIIRNKLTGDTDQKQYSLGHCAWFVYGALMKQGSVLSPVADSTRLIFATWWIFITILTSFYTANLTAFLTLSKFTLPYNTINDILFNNKHFTTIRGSGVEYAIRITNESLSILNKMVLNNRVVFSKITNDSFNLENFVEKNSYVLVRDRPAINHALYKDYRYRKTIDISNEKIHCPFAMAKEPFLKKKRSFAYPIGTNLSELFDPELLNLVEFGIIKHLLASGLPNAEICPQDLGGTERQLRNSDLVMTYYIMGAGFIIAIVIFSTELVFRYVNNRKANKQPFGYDSSVGMKSSSFRLYDKFKNVIGPRGLLMTDEMNSSPPPPYQSIFNRSNNYENHNPIKRPEMTDIDLMGDSSVMRVINGRNYLVIRSVSGQNQLVPMRNPSAALFQYSY